MEVEQVQPTVLPNEDGSIFNNLKVLNVGNGTLRVDKNGMSVAGTVIVDSQGLNSLNNFRSDLLSDIAAFETTSTSFVDITGGTLAPLVLTRPTKVLFYLNVLGRNNTINDNEASVGFSCQARIYDEETAEQHAAVTFKGGLGFYYTFGTPDSWASSVTSIGSAKVIIETIAAGTHTFKAQLKAVNGGTARAGDTDIGYLVLGI